MTPSHDTLSLMPLSLSLTHDTLSLSWQVDGMGASDRGGIPELIKIIKKAKAPIICICNDRQAQKIRSLAGHCYDLKVKRPTKGQIAKRLQEIGAKEGLTVEYNAAEMLVEQVGNDIRQVLHALQMWRAQSTTMKFGDLRDGGMQRIEKDKVGTVGHCCCRMTVMYYCICSYHSLIHHLMRFYPPNSSSFSPLLPPGAAPISF